MMRKDIFRGSIFMPLFIINILVLCKVGDGGEEIGGWGDKDMRRWGDGGMRR